MLMRAPDWLFNELTLLRHNFHLRLAGSAGTPRVSWKVRKTKTGRLTASGSAKSSVNFAMAEQIRQILINEQDHQIDLATALGEEYRTSAAEFCGAASVKFVRIDIDIRFPPQCDEVQARWAYGDTVSRCS
jgi:hypothetical protein